MGRHEVKKPHIIAMCDIMTALAHTQVSQICIDVFNFCPFLDIRIYDLNVWWLHLLKDFNFFLLTKSILSHLIQKHHQ